MYNHQHQNHFNHRYKEGNPFVRYVETDARGFELPDRHMAMDAASGNHDRHLLSSGRADAQGILLPESPRAYLAAQQDTRFMSNAFDMKFPAEGLPNVLDRAGVQRHTDNATASGNQVLSVRTISRDHTGRQDKSMGLVAYGRKRNWICPGDELPIAAVDDSYWEQGRPVEKVYKGTNAYVSVTTAKLPPKDAPVEIKHQCLQTFNIAVDNLMEKAQEKVQIALRAFEYISSNVGMEADIVAGEMDLTDCKVLDEENGTIKFKRMRLYDENLKIIKRPEPNEILSDKHADAQYLGLTLSIKPSKVSTYMEGIEKKELGPKKSAKVYLELPRTSRETLHPDITPARLSTDSTDNIRELINICAGRDPNERGDGTAPLLMTTSDGRSYGTPSAENFRKFAQTNFAEVKYEALKQVFEMSYIGDRGGILSISQRLHAISQDQWDPISKTHINIDCHELYNVISTILKAVNTKSPPEDMPSLPQIAYNALNQDLKTRTYQYLPNGGSRVNGSFPKNVAALHAFMNHAKDEEKLLNRVTETALSAVQGSSNMRKFDQLDSGMPADKFSTTAAVPSECDMFASRDATDLLLAMREEEQRWSESNEKRKRLRATGNEGKYGPPAQNPSSGDSNITALSKKLQDPNISQAESESTLKQLTETVRQARPQSSNPVARRHHRSARTF